MYWVEREVRERERARSVATGRDLYRRHLLYIRYLDERS